MMSSDNKINGGSQNIEEKYCATCHQYFDQSHVHPKEHQHDRQPSHVMRPLLVPGSPHGSSGHISLAATSPHYSQSQRIKLDEQSQQRRVSFVLKNHQHSGGHLTNAISGAHMGAHMGAHSFGQSFGGTMAMGLGGQQFGGQAFGGQMLGAPVMMGGQNLEGAGRRMSQNLTAGHAMNIQQIPIPIYMPQPVYVPGGGMGVGGMGVGSTMQLNGRLSSGSNGSGRLNTANSLKSPDSSKRLSVQKKKTIRIRKSKSKSRDTSRSEQDISIEKGVTNNYKQAVIKEEEVEVKRTDLRQNGQSRAMERQLANAFVNVEEFENDRPVPKHRQQSERVPGQHVSLGFQEHEVDEANHKFIEYNFREVPARNEKRELAQSKEGKEGRTKRHSMIFTAKDLSIPDEVEAELQLSSGARCKHSHLHWRETVPIVEEELVEAHPYQQYFEERMVVASPQKLRQQHYRTLIDSSVLHLGPENLSRTSKFLKKSQKYSAVSQQQDVAADPRRIQPHHRDDHGAELEYVYYKNSRAFRCEDCPLCVQMPGSRVQHSQQLVTKERCRCGQLLSRHCRHCKTLHCRKCKGKFQVQQKSVSEVVPKFQVERSKTLLEQIQLKLSSLL